MLFSHIVWLSPFLNLSSSKQSEIRVVKGERSVKNEKFVQHIHSFSEFFQISKIKVMSFRRAGSRHGSLVFNENRVSVELWATEWNGLRPVGVHSLLLLKSISKILELREKIWKLGTLRNRRDDLY